jgi:hypothetical protein
MNAETTRRDRLAILLGCLMLSAGLCGMDAAGWIDAPLWFIMCAPLLALGIELVFFLPAAILGTFQRHFQR